ncbi:MAG: DUF4912 domain-containing protein [Candidatus Omnitrophica bacterium]|nr:DUF4912 domain-containing protein [Candidatus Omnitrophota bacterium]
MNDNHFNIPYGYGDNKVVLMARDPWTIFSYWETSQDVEDNVRKEISQKGLIPSKSILRVYHPQDGDSSENPTIAFDFELVGRVNSWYIHVDDAGQKWTAEVGILCQTGEFYPIARSNTVSTPDNHISDVCDEGWEDLYYGLFISHGIGTSSLDFRESMDRHLSKCLSSGGSSSGSERSDPVVSNDKQLS